MPRADGVAEGVGEQARELMEMGEVVGGPGGDEVRELDGAGGGVAGRTTQGDVVEWDRLESGEIGVAERVAADVSGAQLIDLTSSFCATWPCSPISGSLLIYRDEDHMTKTFSRSLAAPLSVEIEKLLPR